MSEGTNDISMLGLGVDSRAVANAAGDLKNFQTAAEGAAGAADKIVDSSAKAAGASKSYADALKDKVRALDEESTSAKAAASAAEALAGQWKKIGDLLPEQAKDEEERLRRLAEFVRKQEEAAAAAGASDAAMGKSAKGFEILGFSVEKLTTALVAAAAAFIGLAIHAAMEAEQSMLRLQVALKASGGQAGVTEQQIESLVQQLAEVSKFDDESLRNAAATLLTFGNVAGDTFPRVLRDAADLATFMGTDLNSAVMQLGRALEDPERGMQSLRRAGVVLSEQQRDLVKSFMEAGDIASAQGVILDALEGKYKDAAETMNVGYAGAFSHAKKATSDFLEEIGKLPALQSAVTGTLNAISAAIDRVTEATKRDAAWRAQFLQWIKAVYSDSTSMKAAMLPDQTPNEDARLARAAQAQAALAREVEHTTEATTKGDKAWADYIKGFDRSKPTLDQQIAALEAVARENHVGQEELDRATLALIKHYNETNKDASATKKAAHEKSLYSEVMRDLNREAAIELHNSAEAAKEAESARKIEAAAITANAAALAKYEASQQKELDAVDKQIAGLRRVNETREEAALRINETIIKQYEMEQAMLAGSGEKAEIDRLQRLIDKHREYSAAINQNISDTATAKANKQMADDSVRFWRDAYNEVHDFWGQTLSDMASGSDNVWKNMAARMKSYFINAMSDILAKLTVGLASAALGISNAGASGGGSGGAGGSLLGGIGNSVFSSIGNSLFGGSTLLGYGGIGGLFSGAGGIFGAGAIGNSFALSGIGQTLGLSSMASGELALTSFGTALGAALPVAGVALALAPLIIGALGKHGGPKEGGFAASGPTPGITGTDNSGVRWMTPSGADSTAQEIVAGLQKTFDTYATALGASAKAAFALGFSSDPKGTAPNNVHTGAWVNGMQVYNAAVEGGRGDDALSAEIQRQAQLALIEAFKAAGVSESITKLLENIPLDQFDAKLKDIATAMAALNQIDTKAVFGEVIDMDKLVALTKEGDTFSDTLANLVDVFTTTNSVAQLLGKDVSEAFGAVGLASLDARQNLVDLAGGTQNLAALTGAFYDSFFSDTEKLTLAQNSLSGSFAQLQQQFPELLTTIPQTKDEFKDLVMGLDLSTETGRTLYVALMQLAPTFGTVADAATQAAADMAEATARFNESRTANTFRPGRDGTTPWWAGTSGAPPTPTGGGSRQPPPTETTNPPGTVDVGSLYNNYNLNPSAEAATDWANTINSLTEQVFGQQIALMQQQGQASEALALSREHELAALAGAPQEVIDLTKQLWALQDAAAAAAKAAQIAQQKQQMEIQILELEGKHAEAVALQRQIELAAMDESLRPLQERIWALQDEAAAAAAAAQAAEAAAQAAQKISDTYSSLEDRLLQAKISYAQAIGDSAMLAQLEAQRLALQRAVETAQIAALGDPALLELLQQVYAAEDAARAAAAAQQALNQSMQQTVESAGQASSNIDSITSSLKAFVDRYASELLTPEQRYATMLAQLGKATPEELAKTGESYIEAARVNAKTAAEFRVAVARALYLANQQLLNATSSIDDSIESAGSYTPGSPTGGTQSAGSRGHMEDILRQNTQAMERMTRDQAVAFAAIAKNTNRTARVLEKFDGDGLPETRVL